MKKIITTPAGRKRYLEILLGYLIKYKNEFDRWDLWLNTENISDIDYMKSINKKYDFIKLIYPKIPVNGNMSIGSFFSDYINPDEIYIRLDDDIVYIEKDSLTKLFNERERDKESFLLYGNIINNSILTYIHQKEGNLNSNYGKCEYKCMCDIGWKNPYFAENLHLDFLSKYKNQSFYIPDWDINNNERVSINVISWRGDEFSKFGGIIQGDEEHWLSIVKPQSINKFNKIIGNTLFVHYAFFPQRNYLDTTNILNEYKTILKDYETT
jgi:hypothetical protein